MSALGFTLQIAIDRLKFCDHAQGCMAGLNGVVRAFDRCIPKRVYAAANKTVDQPVVAQYAAGQRFVNVVHKACKGLCILAERFSHAVESTHVSRQGRDHGAASAGGGGFRIADQRVDVFGGQAV